MEKKASEDFSKTQKVLKRSLFIILLNCFILAVRSYEKSVIYWK